MITSTQLSTTRENSRVLINTQNSALAKLPTDLILKILELLKMNDIKAISLTCRGLNALTQDNNLWLFLYHRTFLTPFRTNLPAAKSSCYQSYKRLYSNLTNGVYTSQHTQGTCCLFVDGMVIQGYGNGQIGQWGQDTFQGHTACVTSLLWINGMLVSGSADNTIKVWVLPYQQCLKSLTLEERSGGVTSLLWNGKHLISGSAKGTIQMWNLENGTCVETLRGHVHRVTSLLRVEGKLVSSSLDKTIKIWDLNQNLCLKTMNDSDPVTSLVWTNEYLISATPQMVSRWDINTGERERLPNIKARSLLCIDGILICGGTNLQILDQHSRKCLWKSEEVSNVHALHWAEGKIFFAVQGGAYVYDFNASHEAVFQEIAKQFEYKEKPDDLLLSFFGVTEPYKFDISIPMDRFSRMPRKDREQIQANLYKMLIKRVRGRPAHTNAKNENEETDQIKNICTREDRARAILRYTPSSHKQIKLALLSCICMLMVLKGLSLLIGKSSDSRVV